MKFRETALSGAWRVDLDRHPDDRGFFARTFCEDEFQAAGLASRFEQLSLSHNQRVGTLRGLHFQAEPFTETKFVRCTRGAVFDVVADLRKDSPTFGQWIAEELTADNGVALYIGPGLAHGFQTLAPNSDILYQITPAHQPGLGAGLRWNDPLFGIEWPIANPILHPRDATYPDWPS